MNREELNKMFDKKFRIQGDNFNFICFKKSLPDEIKEFIFSIIIPEVLKSIIPGDNNLSGKLNIDYIKRKAKELYGVNL